MAVSSVQRESQQSPNPRWSLISRKSSAFTLAELMVAIAIIGVLLSLLIPAVQQTREAARRSQCVSQMKQIGLAIHNYETLWRSFPQHDLNTSYLVHILPQLEMGSILNRYNPYLVYDPLAPNSGRNGLLRQTISLYQCPSDPSQRVGAANYAGNFGYGYQKFGSANGVIVNLNQPLRFADVTDGMSQTALISECLKGSRDNPNRLSRIWRTPYALQGTDQLEQFMALCRMTAASGPLPTSLRVISWVDSLPATMYTHTLYPNDVSCRNHGNGTSGIFSATSAHPGGVNLLFCDGHVSFIPTAIDLTVWRSIGTRHGGESVTGF